MTDVQFATENGAHVEWGLNIDLNFAVIACYLLHFNKVRKLRINDRLNQKTIRKSPAMLANMTKYLQWCLTLNILMSSDYIAIFVKVPFFGKHCTYLKFKSALDIELPASNLPSPEHQNFLRKQLLELLFSLGLLAFNSIFIFSLD